MDEMTNHLKDANVPQINVYINKMYIKIPKRKILKYDIMILKFT